MAANSYPMTHLGGQPFSHSQSSDAEAEYERLRSLASQEASKRSSCFDKSHQAYERGDGAAAHQLSEEGKKHAAQMEAYNKQASDYIFRQNNTPGTVDANTIDLHGQYVEEAERILEQRIRYAQANGQTGLHVIVGKGNHSVDHIQKIKPRVELVCQELGLQYVTEENAGRMYINLQGGPAVMPPSQNGHGGHAEHQTGYQKPQQSYEQGYQAPQPPQAGYQSGQQQNNQDDEVVGLISTILRMCCK